MTQHNSIINLDYLAAKYAQNVIEQTDKVEKASDVENAVTKALGVLQENGVYACFVFALSRTKQKDDGEATTERDAKGESLVMWAITKQMLALLKKLNYNVSVVDNLNAQQILSEVAEKVTQDLERLLLAKEVLEQMLIYARYGAKARPDK